jgi:hypothetical protein
VFAGRSTKRAAVGSMPAPSVRLRCVNLASSRNLGDRPPTCRRRATTRGRSLVGTAFVRDAEDDRSGTSALRRPPLGRGCNGHIRRTRIGTRRRVSQPWRLSKRGAQRGRQRRTKNVFPVDQEGALEYGAGGHLYRLRMGNPEINAARFGHCTRTVPLAEAKGQGPADTSGVVLGFAIAKPATGRTA